jgi:hypothetical protein
VPKQDQYTLDEAKARAAEVGDEWTPELERSLRNSGKIKAPPTFGDVPWYEELAKNVAMGVAMPSVTPLGGMAATPIGQQLGAGMVTGATASNVDPGVSAPTTGLERFANTLGQGVGIFAPFAATSGATGLAATALRAPALAATAAKAMLPFAAYGAAEPGTAKEKSKRAIVGAATGGVLGAVGKGVGLVNEAIGKSTISPVAKKVLSSVIKSPATDVATITGMGVASGQPIKESFESAVPMAIGNRLAHAALNEQKLSKSPAEMEVPASPEIADLQKAMDEPRPGSRLSAAVNPYLTGKDPNAANIAARIKAGGLDGVVTPERSAEIRAQVEAEVESAKEQANSLGKVFDRNSVLGGMAVDDAARMRELEESVNPEFVRALQKYNADLAAGGKGELRLNQGVNRARVKGPIYLFQEAGGGDVGGRNPVAETLIRPIQAARQVSYSFSDNHMQEMNKTLDRLGVKTGSPEDSAVSKLIEGAGKAGVTPEEYSTTPEGRAIFAGENKRGRVRPVKNIAGVIRAANELSAQLERIRVERNDIVENSGGNPIQKREGFAPKYEQELPWYDIVGKAKKSYAGPTRLGQMVPGGRAAQEGIKRDPHAKPRTKGDENRDWSVRRSMSRYIAEEARVVGGQLGLTTAYNHAELLDLYGHRNMAEIVRQYAQADFNKKPYGWLDGLDKAGGEGGLTQVWHDFWKWNYNRLADAVFTANIPWNMAVQPSSAAFVIAGDTRGAAKGAGYLSPEFQKFVDKNVFSRQVKARLGGSISDIGIGRESMGQEDLSGAAKIRYGAQWINRVIEQNIDYYAAYVAMERGKRLGLKGRELVDFMSDDILKTQDVYNAQDRPGVLRSKSFNVLFPFSGFGFNMVSNLREQGAIPFVPRTGAWKARQGAGNRIAYTSRLVLSGVVANVVARTIFGRKDLYGPSALPLYDTMTGEGFSKGLLGPAVEYQLWKRSVDDIRNGKWGQAAARAIRGKVSGGVLMSNMINAVDFSEGNGPFLLPQDQIALALVVGVWGTPAGKEYIAQSQPESVTDKLIKVFRPNEDNPFDEGRKLEAREVSPRKTEPRKLSGRR